MNLRHVDPDCAADLYQDMELLKAFVVQPVVDIQPVVVDRSAVDIQPVVDQPAVDIQPVVDQPAVDIHPVVVEVLPVVDQPVVVDQPAARRLCMNPMCQVE